MTNAVRILLLGAGLAVFGGVARAAKPTADIAPPERRRTVVETAEHLANPPPVTPVAADIPQPFAPPNFDRPTASAADAHENAAGSAAAAAPQTDSDFLAAIAAKIPTTGTIIVGGKPLLISGTNRIEIGSRFTVLYNGQECELELVAIDRTTFTVRYKGVEFTRPIKLGKTTP
jgi:hypothetical protein